MGSHVYICQSLLSTLCMIKIFKTILYYSHTVETTTNLFICLFEIYFMLIPYYNKLCDFTKIILRFHFLIAFLKAPKSERSLSSFGTKSQIFGAR